MLDWVLVPCSSSRKKKKQEKKSRVHCSSSALSVEATAPANWSGLCMFWKRIQNAFEVDSERGPQLRRNCTSDNVNALNYHLSLSLFLSLSLSLAVSLALSLLSLSLSHSLSLSSLSLSLSLALSLSLSLSLSPSLSPVSIVHNRNSIWTEPCYRDEFGKSLVNCKMGMLSEFHYCSQDRSCVRTYVLFLSITLDMFPIWNVFVGNTSCVTYGHAACIYPEHPHRLILTGRNTIGSLLAS